MEIRNVVSFLSRRVEPYSLEILRIFYGILALTILIRYFYYGWVEEYFLRPKFFLKHPGLEWLFLPSAEFILLGFYGMLLLAIFILLGIFSRASLFFFSILFLSFHLSNATIFLNHYYLFGVLGFLLSLSPTGKVWSWDSFQEPFQSRKIPYYWILVLRFQFGIVYFFGGIAKLKPDWLLEAKPLRLWLTAFQSSWIPDPIQTILSLPITAYAFSWIGMLFDLCIPFVLSISATRIYAWFVLCIFHGITGVLFPIGVFPWIMVFGTLIFFPPIWPVKFVQTFLCLSGFLQNQNRKQKSSHSKIKSLNDFSTPLRSQVLKSSESSISPAVGNLVFNSGKDYASVLLLSFYVIFMLGISARYLFYDGDVLWTEEGFNFSWHVMIAEKVGSAEFNLRGISSDGSKVSISVDPLEFLTPYQYKMMAISPDQILQFALILANHYETKYKIRVTEVTVDSHVSLNGREAIPLYDKSLNLLSVKRNFLLRNPYINSGKQYESLGIQSYEIR